MKYIWFFFNIAQIEIHGKQLQTDIYVTLIIIFSLYNNDKGKESDETTWRTGDVCMFVYFQVC